MKHLILVLFLLFFNLISAQIPSGYYASILDLADDNLKFELNQIIDNHIEFTYMSSNTDVWDILKETDRDPNNSENVILIYSGLSINAAQEYNNANGWTREHIWAKSRGDFGTYTGVGPIGKGNSQGLAGEIGLGKVVALGDSNGFVAMIFEENDGSKQAAGMNLKEYDWKQFVLNTLHWLSGK